MRFIKCQARVSNEPFNPSISEICPENGSYQRPSKPRYKECRQWAGLRVSNSLASAKHGGMSCRISAGAPLSCTIPPPPLPILHLYYCMTPLWSKSCFNQPEDADVSKLRTISYLHSSMTLPTKFTQR